MNLYQRNELSKKNAEEDKKIFDNREIINIKEITLGGETFNDFHALDKFLKSLNPMFMKRIKEEGLGKIEIKGLGNGTEFRLL